MNPTEETSHCLCQSLGLFYLTSVVLVENGYEGIVIVNRVEVISLRVTVHPEMLCTHMALCFSYCTNGF